jgi:hypothetical protein
VIALEFGAKQPREVAFCSGSRLQRRPRTGSWPGSTRSSPANSARTASTAPRRRSSTCTFADTTRPRSTPCRRSPPSSRRSSESRGVHRNR